MDISDVSRNTANGLEVDILVSPRSNRSGPEGFDPWRKRLILRVRSPPLDGKANKEVEEMMKELSGFKSSIVNGQLSRQKTVLISGNPEEILLVLKERT